MRHWPVLVPVALVGAAFGVWSCRAQKATPPARVVAAPPAPVPVPVPEPEPVAVDAPAALVAIGKARAIAPVAEPPSDVVVPSLIFSAAPACVRPTAQQIAATTAQLAAWLAQHHPDETRGVDKLALGCVDDASRAIVVGVASDGVRKHPPPNSGNPAWAEHRTYVLRVSPDAVTVLAETGSTSMEEVGEWAAEGYVEPIALADLDGDGHEDVVLAAVEHEGGGYLHPTIEVALSSTFGAKPRAVGTFWGEIHPSAALGRLVLGLAPRGDDGPSYACLSATSGALERCPAADAVARAAAAEPIAARLASGAAAADDRDTLADELAALDVPAQAAAPLVAAARAPTPRERASRTVAALVARELPPPDRLADLLAPDREHAEARAYFDRLEAELRDRACPVPPVTAAFSARAQAWVRRRRRDATVEVTPACGPYAWVRWVADDDSTHDTLFGTSGAPVVNHVTPFAPPQMVSPMRPASAFVLDGTGTPVGWVHDGERVLAVAHDRIVGHLDGGGFYKFRMSLPDVARDLVTGDGRVLHVTAAGFVPVAPAELVAHDAREAALETLAGFAHETPHDRPAVLAALATLHADAELVALVTSL